MFIYFQATPASRPTTTTNAIMDNKTDPVIIDLIEWLKENLPDVEEADIFRKVRKIQKIFDILIGLTFEEFYNRVLSDHTNDQKDDCQTVTTLEEVVNERLKDMKEYINLNEEKQMKTKKLNASRAKLELKREQYMLINSVRFDKCMDLISRYNHLTSKK